MNIYFDLETEGFEPEKHKIVTFQYQELDYKGIPMNKLTILKEWEIGEMAIVTKIYDELIKKEKWNWIPIGTNLIFDFTFIWAKFKKYNLITKSLSDFLYEHPIIDIKYTLIMANNLSFKGSGLDQMTNKTMDGKNVRIWYQNKEYKKIEDYIKMETESFIEFFKNCLDKLPNLVKCNTTKKSM